MFLPLSFVLSNKIIFRSWSLGLAHAIPHVRDCLRFFEKISFGFFQFRHSSKPNPPEADA
jgi:hypothetical protein